MRITYHFLSASLSVMNRPGLLKRWTVIPMFPFPYTHLSHAHVDITGNVEEPILKCDLYVIPLYLLPLSLTY